MLNIAICEDNKKFASNLKDIINKKLIKNEIDFNIDVFLTGENLIYSVFMKNKNYHIIFFDINLAGVSGIDTAKKIRKENKDILFIFITELDDEVYKILDLNIFHFIRKSYFEVNIDKVLNLLIENIDQFIKRYSFSTISGETEIKLTEIIYFEIINRHVCIETRSAKIETTYRTLKDLPINLEKRTFFRINKGQYVNLNHINYFTENKIILSNGEHLYIARRRIKDFKTHFFDFMIENGGI